MRGDHILVLPALRALAGLFAGRLTLICGTGARALYFSDVDLRRVIETPFDLDGNGEFDAEAIAAGVGQCDLFVSLLPWYARSVQELLRYLTPDVMVGLNGDFSHVVPNSRKHSADMAFDLARCFDPRLDFAEYSAPPVFCAAAQARAEQLCNRLPRSARVLALHSETKARKTWPADRFTDVVDGFLERHPEFVVVVVDEKPSAINRGRHADRVFSFPGNPIDVAFCLVAQADCFLGVDSCMLHVADFCRVPGVGLFGPSSSHEFGFRVTPHVHVCGDGSMNSIQAGAVSAALETVVGLFPRRDGSARGARP